MITARIRPGAEVPYGHVRPEKATQCLGRKCRCTLLGLCVAHMFLANHLECALSEIVSRMPTRPCSVENTSTGLSKTIKAEDKTNPKE